MGKMNHRTNTECLNERDECVLKGKIKGDANDIKYYIPGETWIMGKNKTAIHWPDGSNCIGLSIEECIYMLSLYEKLMKK